MEVSKYGQPFKMHSYFIARCVLITQCPTNAVMHHMSFAQITCY